MRTAALGRWLGATIAGALLLTAAPDLASAATQPSTTATITPYLHGIAVTPGGGSSEAFNSRVSNGYGFTEVDNLTVTMDTSKLPAGASLGVGSDVDWQCTTSTGSVVCSATKPFPLGYQVGFKYADTESPTIYIRAAAGAGYGLGSLTVTDTADGLTSVSTTVPVGIAEPVKLVAANPATSSFTGPPGSTYSPQWTVTNAGTTTVHRVSLLIQSDLGFDLAKHYSNCRYYPASEEVVPETPVAGAICTFDNDLAPGVTYGVSVTVAIAADHEAPFQGLTEAEWHTPLDLTTVANVGGTPGTDGPLNLVVQSTQAAAPPLTQPDLPQTGSYHTDTYVNVTVTGVNPADLAAIGSSVAGPQWGGSVAITVGVIDQGPAAATINRSVNGLTDVTVTLPAGATATAVPLECAPYVYGGPDWQHAGKPGFGEYDCAVYQELAVHQTFPLPFTVRVPAGAAPLVGSVTVGDNGNPADDTASIVITPQVLGRQGGAPGPPMPRR
jgi:hypothetical protein